MVDRSGDDSGSRRPWIVITNFTLQKPITFKERLIYCSLLVEAKNVGSSTAHNVMTSLSLNAQYLIRNRLQKRPNLDIAFHREQIKRLSGKVERTLVPGSATGIPIEIYVRPEGMKTERAFLLFGIFVGYRFADELAMAEASCVINERDAGIGIRIAEGAELQVDDLSLQLSAEIPFAN